MVESIVGGENVSYQHFLLFPQCFLKVSYLVRAVKTQDCVVRGSSFVCLGHRPYTVAQSVVYRT